MTNPDRDELVKPRKHYFVPSDDDFDTCARCGKNIRNDEHCSNTERPETDAEYIDRLESALRRLASSDSGVKDTYLVGGADLKAMSGDIDSNRVIKLHFNRPTTDKDREWLLDAINLKIRSDQGTAPPADAGMREALKLAHSTMESLRVALRDDPAVHDRKWIPHGIALNAAIRKADNALADAAITAPGATTKSDGGWNEAIEACIQAVRQTGNFGDYKREELTADYGRPKFDMMNAIINALTALRSEALTKSDGGGESRPAHPGTGGRAPCIEQTTPATMPAQAGVAPGPSEPSSTRSDPNEQAYADLIASGGIFPEAYQQGEASMTDDQIKHMVDRFLMWKLPEHFNPDCGISFDQSYRSEHGPVGTNLFDAVQATAMVRHMLEGLPSSTRSDVTVDIRSGVLSAIRSIYGIGFGTFAGGYQNDSIERAADKIVALLDQFEIRRKM